ncbi:hypothetical protein ABH917_004431 [Thermobifida halotolerans]
MSSGPVSGSDFWRELNSKANAAAKANGTAPSHEIRNHVSTRLTARAHRCPPGSRNGEENSSVAALPRFRPETATAVKT